MSMLIVKMKKKKKEKRKKSIAALKHTNNPSKQNTEYRLDLHCLL